MGIQRPYRRKQWIVNPPLQYRFVVVMLITLLIMTAGALGSVYGAIWIVLRTFDLTQNAVAVAEVTTVGLIITAELLLISPCVIWIGIRWTHKIAGPLVRILATIQQMAQGDFNVHLKLRKGDSLVELAEAINELAVSLRSSRS
jgi:signal transduction histidine kinase